MAAKYYIKTLTGQWEEVNAFIFENRKFAIADEGGGPRYTDQFVFASDGGLQFSGSFPLNEMGLVCRFLGVRVPTESFPKPICSEPTTIRVHKRKAVMMHHLATGENWKKAA